MGEKFPSDPLDLWPQGPHQPVRILRPRVNETFDKPNASRLAHIVHSMDGRGYEFSFEPEDEQWMMLVYDWGCEEPIAWFYNVGNFDPWKTEL